MRTPTPTINRSDKVRPKALNSGQRRIRLKVRRVLESTKHIQYIVLPTLLVFLFENQSSGQK